MKIYAITKGIYSDYHICALTVNKEKAEYLKKIYTDKWNEADIEIYEDGEGSELNLFYFCDQNGCNPKIRDYAENERVAVDRFGKIYGVYLYAKDESHAEKKAQDMIAEYKANKVLS